MSSLKCNSHFHKDMKHFLSKSLSFTTAGSYWRLFQEFHLHTSERAQQHHANSSASTSTESLPTSVITKPLVISYLSKCCNLVNEHFPTPGKLPIRKYVVVDCSGLKSLMYRQRAIRKNHAEVLHTHSHLNWKQLIVHDLLRMYNCLNFDGSFTATLIATEILTLLLYESKFRVAEALHQVLFFRVKSREELEEEEIAKMPKFKARPLNKMVRTVSYS